MVSKEVIDSLRGTRNLDGYLYSLPSELLGSIIEIAGKHQIPSEVLQHERELAKAAGDHSAAIGYLGERAIHYDLLADKLSVFTLLSGLSDEFRKSLNWPENIWRNQDAWKTADGRLSWARTAMRGYAGWLILNPLYLHEQEEFFRENTKGISLFGMQPPVQLLAGSDRTAEGLFEPYCRSLGAFCRRWHLTGLAGPFLPQPVGLQFPLLRLPAGPDDSAPLGATLFIPAICPVPGRKELRAMVEEAIPRKQAPANIQAWLEIVRKESSAKKALERYARIFRLHHFWRVAHGRFRSAFTGNVERLRRAFAVFLLDPKNDVEVRRDAEVIRKDLQALHKVHGLDWGDAMYTLRFEGEQA